ncbi:MAG: DUF2334 domain-containing protein [Ignavibacteriaceae bacterium]
MFRIDDYGIDNQSFFNEIFKIADNYNIKLIVSVIPFKRFGDEQYSLSETQILLLKKYIQKGVIEIALHGYEHKDNFLNDLPSEFSNIPFEEQYNKIKIAKDYLERTFLVPIKLFVPPWNRYDMKTLLAIKKNGINILSASVKDNTESIENIYYLPYTVEINHFYRFYCLNNEKLKPNSLYIVNVHSYNFKGFAIPISISSANQTLSFKNLSTLFNKINYEKHTTSIIDSLIVNHDLSKNRFVNNIYKSFGIHTIALFDFNTNYYLLVDENKSVYPIVYEVIFYPILFVFFLLILKFIKRKIRGRISWWIEYNFVIVIVSFSIILLLIDGFKPKVLILIIFGFSLIIEYYKSISNLFKLIYSSLLEIKESKYDFRE